MTLKQRKPSREPVVVHDESRGTVLRQALMEIGRTPSDPKPLHKRVKGSHVEVKREELYDLRRLAILGNGLARVAHEIKNRLAIIGGFAVRIGKKPKDTARVGEFSEIICEEVRKLETLLGSLRELSRPVTASKKTESLNAIVKQIMDRLHAGIPRHIKVKLDLEPSTPKVRVVKRRMEQVITNLVRNSIEVMKEKATSEYRRASGRKEPSWSSKMMVQASPIKYENGSLSRSLPRRPTATGSDWSSANKYSMNRAV